jgi:hypothetical protein
MALLEFAGLLHTRSCVRIFSITLKENPQDVAFSISKQGLRRQASLRNSSFIRYVLDPLKISFMLLMIQHCLSELETFVSFMQAARLTFINAGTRSSKLSQRLQNTPKVFLHPSLPVSFSYPLPAWLFVYGDAFSGHI